MMQGHNRPPFAPTIPGTNLRSHDVPTAIIPPRPRHDPDTGFWSSNRHARRTLSP